MRMYKPAKAQKPMLPWWGQVPFLTIEPYRHDKGPDSKGSLNGV